MKLYLNGEEAYIGNIYHIIQHRSLKHYTDMVSKIHRNSFVLNNKSMVLGGFSLFLLNWRLQNRHISI